MPARSKYRKWTDPDGDYLENFLMVHHSGRMVQISFNNDGVYGNQVLIYQTKPLNPFKVEVFLQYKETATKAEWLGAQKRAKELMSFKL